jgi:heat shock protein HslJ
MGWLVVSGLLVQTGVQSARAAEDARSAAKAELVGKRWAWDSFTSADAGALVPPHPENYWVQFLPEGKLVLQADCNRGFGTWTEEDGGVHLKPLGTTLMACPEGSLDSRFLELLTRASQVGVRGTRLLLRGPAGVLRLSLVPAQALLTESAWTLVAVEGKDGVTPILPGHSFVEFRKGGALLWKSDCQEGPGTWTAKEGSLRLDAEKGAPSAACTEATPGLDFRRRLEKTARFSFEGTDLVLDGAPQGLRFRAAPSPF